VAQNYLEKTRLADQAYDQIRILILDQEIPAGQVVSIDTLAARLGVSQTPIREALSKLEGDGLVEKLRTGRYQAAPPLIFKDYADLYAMRLLLEPRAAGLAAQNRTDDTIATLAQAVDRIAAAGRGMKSEVFIGFVEADALFHQTIARDCGNKFVAAGLFQLQANSRVGPFYRDRGVVDAEAVIRDHTEIFNAIKARDAEAAELHMQRHIERARDLILGWLKTQPEQSFATRSQQE
jgi:DNA-binding GntR family transcriptional regulator